LAGFEMNPESTVAGFENGPLLDAQNLDGDPHNQRASRYIRAFLINRDSGARKYPLLLCGRIGRLSADGIISH
jgi:hypothetical protein